MQPAAIESLVAETYDPDPSVRKQATRELCPCEIKVNRPDVWKRILELTRDPDLGVRRTALHTLVDGSPRELQSEVAAAFEVMRDDPDPKLRRQVRKRLARYRRTGKIN